MRSAIIWVAMMTWAIPAFAEKARPLAVIPVIVGQELKSQDVIRWVAESMRDLVGIRVLSDEELFVLARDDLLGQLRACGSERACLLTRFCSLDISWGLLIGLNDVADPPFIAARLIDCDTHQFAGESIGVPDAGQDIAAAVRARARSLVIAAGHVIAGQIIVSATPPSARISIDNGLEATRDNVFIVAPGAHRVLASRDGFASKEVSVTVASGEKRRVDLVLEPESSLFESPWFWGAIAATVVAGVVVTLSIVALSSTPNVCVGSATTGCP